MKTKHLIIGGTTKSGTTSLFQYLGHHPDVCPSSMKETRFFLDKDYPLDSRHRWEDGIEKYLNFFTHYGSERFMMEATPDYLYSKNTSKKIKKTLGSAKLIFILREPKARLISWYNFSKQIGKINPETSLVDYIKMQVSAEGLPIEQHLMALEQGNYSVYLKEYFRFFSSDDICICYFEDLVLNPFKFMGRISEFLGIDGEFYNQYNFEQHNATVNIKNQAIHRQYIAISFALRKFTHNKLVLHGFLKNVKKLINPLYKRANSNQLKSDGITEEALQMLDDYYQQEKKNYQLRYAGLFHQLGVAHKYAQ